jgi:hypothetical protein
MNFLSALGIGASRSRSSSQSQSSSSGFSVSGSSDAVFGADLYSELFGRAAGAAGAVNTDALTTGANRLFDSGAGFLEQLDALAGGGPVGAGEDFLTAQLGGGDDLVRQEIDTLQADLGEFYSETLLPGIRGEGIATGGLGGSREGVAQGIAGKALLREFGRGVLDIRQNDQARRTSIAQQLATTQLQRRLAAAGAGLGALPQQFQLLQESSLAALSPFAALADILGDPTVLSSAYAYGREESQSTSSSSGKSDSLQLGLTGV